MHYEYWIKQNVVSNGFKSLLPTATVWIIHIYCCFLRLPIIIVFTHSLSHLSNADILAAYLALQSSQGDITSLANLASSTQSL